MIRQSPILDENSSSDTAVVGNSSTSSLVDVYIYKALLQSPIARRDIITCVSTTTTTTTGGMSSNQQQRQQQRRRRVRVRRGMRTDVDDGDGDAIMRTSEEQKQQVKRHEDIRQSLMNPWCQLPLAVASSAVTEVQENDCNDESESEPSKVTPTFSPRIFREWIQRLSSSWCTLHLQTFQMLLEEQNVAKRGTNDGWWEMCYVPIVTTIRTMTHRRLYRQRSDPQNGITSDQDGRQHQQPSSTTKNVKSTKTSFRFQLNRIAPLTADSKAVKTRQQRQHREELIETLYQHHPSDDDVLAMSLSVVNAMIPVLSFTKLEEWFRSRAGIENAEEEADDDGDDDATIDVDNSKIPNGDVDRSSTITSEKDFAMVDADTYKRNAPKENSVPSKKKTVPSQRSSPGGLFVVSMLLELLEGLQFLEWSKQEHPLASVHLHSMNSTMNIEPTDLVLPTWYQPIIQFFISIGRTYAGMKVLRTRLPDFKDYDMMGNALDVSVRNLHVLVQFWDAVDLVQPRSVLRFRPSKHDGVIDDVNQTNARRQAGRVIEMWIRFWHQNLLYVAKHDKGSLPNGSCFSNLSGVMDDHEEACGVAFRSLFVDVQDWLTSAYAILLNSTDTRPEIKSMIWLQLQELSLDEEERNDSKQ